MSSIRSRRTLFATTVALLLAATNLAAQWGDRELAQADRDRAAAIQAAEGYVQAALRHDDLATRYVAPQFGGRVPAQLSMVDTLRVACHLVAEGDRRYHRYLELVQVRVRLQAQSQPLPRRLVEELDSLRAPPMQPRHLVRSAELLAACDQPDTALVAGLRPLEHSPSS
ncbi:hypothetical protein [Abyssibacter profundi]|uniref:Uncharacterized protein n=1 Tax=Abyssibacter profundi TaxID=2182787 RepID=A0A383XQT3_9GAMM|nr:hypothetical protein [Abyssibacter profundi]PWN54987.1 hypothetical protein DEH80_14720 [Abyssibacter profundi]